jgi:transcriptional regulator with XRE-family HTH domain
MIELRLRLEANHISLGELARTMHVHRSQGARWFNALVQPRLDTLIKIERAVQEIVDSRRSGDEATELPVPNPNADSADPMLPYDNERAEFGISLVAYTKVELWGGPADGEVLYVALPMSALKVPVSASDANGEHVAFYTIDRDEVGYVAYFVTAPYSETVDDAILRRELHGRRATRFLHCPA